MAVGNISFCGMKYTQGNTDGVPTSSSEDRAATNSILNMNNNSINPEKKPYYWSKEGLLHVKTNDGGRIIASDGDMLIIKKATKNGETSHVIAGDLARHAFNYLMDLTQGLRETVGPQKIKAKI